jgi:hypothetical protein
MKKIDVVEVYYRDNEIHFVLREHKNSKCLKKANDISDNEIKKIMKKEAPKPLLLLRAE